MERQIKASRDAERNKILIKFRGKNDLVNLLTAAANILINEADDQTRSSLEGSRDRILHSSIMSEVEKKYSLIALLLDIKSEPGELEIFLEQLDQDSKK
jgi:hypothetical protein